MDALQGRWLNGWRKIFTATTQECCEQFWTSPRGNTTQSTSCTATYLPSRKLSKLDKPDTQDTAGEARNELISNVLLWTPSYGRAKAGWPAGTYIQQFCEDTGCGPDDQPEAEQKQGDQLEPTYSSSVRIRDVALTTSQKRWTIERSGERVSGTSMHVARQDDDDLFSKSNCFNYKYVTVTI